MPPTARGANSMQLLPIRGIFENKQEQKSDKKEDMTTITFNGGHSHSRPVD